MTQQNDLYELNKRVVGFMRDGPDTWYSQTMRAFEEASVDGAELMFDLCRNLQLHELPQGPANALFLSGLCQTEPDFAIQELARNALLLMRGRHSTERHLPAGMNTLDWLFEHQQLATRNDLKLLDEKTPSYAIDFLVNFQQQYSLHSTKDVQSSDAQYAREWLGVVMDKILRHGGSLHPPEPTDRQDLLVRVVEHQTAQRNSGLILALLDHGVNPTRALECASLDDDLYTLIQNHPRVRRSALEGVVQSDQMERPAAKRGM